MDGTNLDVWVALVAAIFGGAGLKLVETFISRRQRRDDLLGKLVADKDREIARLSEQIDDAESKEAEWREKYWELRDKGPDHRTE